jgi:hypothetical protein
MKKAISRFLTKHLKGASYLATCSAFIGCFLGVLVAVGTKDKTSIFSAMILLTGFGMLVFGGILDAILIGLDRAEKKRLNPNFCEWP